MLTMTGETTARRAVEVSAQLDAKTARAEELLLERDALRSSEADLRRELKEAGRIEAELRGKLGVAEAAGERLGADLAAARGDVAR